LKVILSGSKKRITGVYGILGLLHDSDASVPLGDVYTNPPRFGGLNRIRGVRHQRNAIGWAMLIDLAHANMQTTEAALKVTTGRSSISHTGLDTRLGSDPRMAQMMRPRLISKEQAKMVANVGGLIGVWTHLADTPLEYARNVRALVDVIGVDHVCIGTDTKLTQPPFGPPAHPVAARRVLAARRSSSQLSSGSKAPANRGTDHLHGRIKTAGFYYVVVDAMLKTGFSPDEIGKVGGRNYLRIFGEAVGK